MKDIYSRHQALRTLASHRVSRPDPDEAQGLGSVGSLMMKRPAERKCMCLTTTAASVLSSVKLFRDSKMFCF